MKSYPMIAVLAVVIAVLLSLDAFRPSLLLYATDYPAIDSLRTYTFVLTSEGRAAARTTRYRAEALGVGSVLLYVANDIAPLSCHPSSFSLGDTLVAPARIRRGARIGSFDYGLYLRRRGIIGTAFVYHYSRIPNDHRPLPNLQSRLYRRLEAGGLSGDQLATAGALTLGYKEDLDPQLRRRFQSSGAAHVLAVSGLHTGILYTLLLSLLTLGGRLRPGYDNRPGRFAIAMVVTAVMWGYAWLTGMTPSVVRCVLMITLVEIGRVLYRYSPTLNTIAAAAVLILLIRPLDLWSLSFQLSFAATFAIVLLLNSPGSVFRTIGISESRTTSARRLVNYFLGLVLVSLAAQLGTLPITLSTFGALSNYFLLTNLIVLPLTTLLVPCGLATVALGGTLPGRLVGCITNALAWLMNHSVGWIESLPGSSTAVQITMPMALLLYAALLMGWLTLHRNLWWLIGVAASLGLFCTLYAL